MPFPTTAVIDSFTRANQAPPGAGWSTAGIFNSASSSLQVLSNALADAGTFTGGYFANATYGPDAEIYFTCTVLAPNSAVQVEMMVRWTQPGTAAYSGYGARVSRNDGNPGVDVELRRYVSGSLTSLLTVY